MAPRFASRPVLAVSLLFATAAAAQEVPAPQLPTPTATPTPTPVPTATAAPLPIPTPTPEATPGVEALPTPFVVPTSRPTPAAIPRAASASPTPTATPTTSPTPAPTPAPSPTRAPPSPIETVILPQPRTAIPLWPWLLGGGAFLTVMLGWILFRRPREESVDEEVDAEPLVKPAPSPTPPLAGQARLTVALHPIRAGLNLISATADCEVTVANTGGAPADDVRAALRLMSAHEDQDAELAAFYAAPVAKPATPTFALAPGEKRTFRAITALPHDAIHALDAGGRPMFVPMLALSVVYLDGAAARRVGRAFALGVERVDSAKLGPFWLDGGARSYDNVAARPHGEPVES